ncbi:TNF receptor-associated factor 3-like [Dendronephthya gigantea]|uniref:TNF receptor-associated factor 3-like n=1 Tax=Dendronephthya gigantea TaxID=151771 RepID=UPI00106B13E1|nr:TNF receptor-associated factor 3-like [Dendronephthya gigantea]XP_028415914.1 TNF receptor-associated factor 3-like [Dendronephthya gigantea]
MPGEQISDRNRKKINKKFLCTKCSLLLKEPMQTICGHLICKGCVQNILGSGNSVCPVDGTELKENNVFLDRYTQRELVTLTLHCVNEECDWFGAGKELQAHINTCDYTVIKCVHGQCSKEIQRRLLAKHLDQECQYRSVQCESCHETLAFSSLQKHIDEDCPEAPLTCEYCEVTNIPRREMRKHLGEDCEENEQECDFKQLGCDHIQVSKRKVLRKHYKDASRFHIQLLIQFIFALKSEMQNFVSRLNGSATMEVVVDKVNEVKDAISVEIMSINNKIAEIMTAITEMTRRMDNMSSNQATGSNGAARNSEIRRVEVKMEKEVEKLQLRNNRLELQLREKTEIIERYKNKVEQLDESVAIMTAKFADLNPREPLQTKVNYNGTLLWKIEGYQRKRQDAINGVKTALYSPHFYSAQFGYKMCAKIYMNGDGFGKGSHLSLFFVVMKGEFDALQTWPFQKKITMMLLDQGNGDHMVDAFHSDPQSSSFQRPKSDMNIASGSPLFMPIDNLNNRQYIKDDVMFIKIVVD